MSRGHTEPMKTLTAPAPDITNKTLRFIGYVGVDSGQVMITDPCYLAEWKADDFTEQGSRLDYSYSGACNATLGENGGNAIGSGTQGVASRTAFGDGCYPVYQILSASGNVVEGLFVDFNGIVEGEDDDASEDDDEQY